MTLASNPIPYLACLIVGYWLGRHVGWISAMEVVEDMGLINAEDWIEGQRAAAAEGRQ